jgi:hypothetical protein
VPLWTAIINHHSPPWPLGNVYLIRFIVWAALFSIFTY